MEKEKRIYTEETLLKMAGFLPFSKKASVRFTPEQLIVEGQKVLPVFTRTHLSDEAFDEMRDQAKTTVNARAFLKKWFGTCGIMSWENLPDRNTGEMVASAAESIESFSKLLVWALYNRIRESEYGPTEDEKEGLESSPPSESAQ